MARMKKQSETLSNFVKEIRETFPDTRFTIWPANSDIIKDYGDGFILRGERGVFSKEFFILIEDTRRVAWAAMINGELEKEIDNATQ